MKTKNQATYQKMLQQVGSLSVASTCLHELLQKLSALLCAVQVIPCNVEHHSNLQRPKLLAAVRPNSDTPQHKHVHGSAEWTRQADA